MPSPFPGMDPYLEHPMFFPGLHDSFVTYLREALQPVLPSPYFAEISDRAWVEVDQRLIEPDVNVLHRFDAPPDSTGGGLAVAAETIAEPLVITVPHDEFHEPFLNIFAAGDTERLVTSIEVLSLKNKTAGAQGRDLYLRKQREILASEINLVEIDLLRGGQHTTAVSEWRLRKKAGRFDYHVCIKPFHVPEDFFVYPIQLTQPLPVIKIPLLPHDPSVAVDLQAVFNRCYETGPYHRRLRYAEAAPVPALSEAQQAWARQRIESGARG